MKKITLGAIAIVISLGVVGIIYLIPPEVFVHPTSINHSTHRVSGKPLTSEVVYQPEECADKPVIVVVSGVEISVPRRALVRLESGESVNDLKWRCDIQKVENVQNARWAVPEAFQFIKSGMGSTTYQSRKLQIEKAIRDQTIETLPDGVQKITLPGSDTYVLPKDQAPTANGEPVVFRCTGNTGNIALTNQCHVSYEHPLGFKFSYRFTYRKFTPDEFIALDQSRRSQVNKLIEAARKSSEHKEGE